MKDRLSYGGRTIANLSFADDIDFHSGKQEELIKLVNQLDKASTTYGMDISAEKIKLMTNNTKGISSGISGQNVQSFKYLASVITVEGTKQEILSRIARTIGALWKLKTIGIC